LVGCRSVVGVSLIPELILPLFVCGGVI
jgi:hypothetical protein